MYVTCDMEVMNVFLLKFGFHSFKSYIFVVAIGLILFHG